MKELVPLNLTEEKGEGKGKRKRGGGWEGRQAGKQAGRNKFEKHAETIKRRLSQN